MKYIVKRVISNSWEVGFHDIDDNDKKTPTVFDTAEAAEKEIQSYLAEVMQAVADGHMASSDETRDDLQIVSLECPMCGTGVDECLEDATPVVCRECASLSQGAIGEPTHEPRS